MPNVIMLALTHFQISIFLSIHTVHLQKYELQVVPVCLSVCLSLKFSVASKLLTVSFKGNNSKQFRESKIQFHRTDCHKRSVREDVICGVCLFVDIVAEITANARSDIGREMKVSYV